MTNLTGKTLAWNRRPLHRRTLAQGLAGPLARVLGIAAALFWCGTFLPGNIRAEKQIYSEYEIKAAFIYNFMKFVEWPADALPQSGSPLVIGIFGKDPFGPVLDNAVKDRTAQGRSIIVRRFASLDEVRNCQLLFIAASENGRLALTLEHLKGLPVLTVGDSPGWARKGVIINFFIADDKVQFEINVDATGRSGLKISSKLLSLARVVKD